jgi:coronin-1B/1C/6
VFSDGNIRYFEYENDKFEYLSEYKSADPQRGLAFIPKRGLNMHENEVMRAFKTVNDSYIEPISFIVPRRSEVFQGDIYPPVVGGKPAVSSAEWFDGKDGLPPKIDLESVYAGEEPTEIVSEYKPPTPLTARLPPVTKNEPGPVKQALQPEPSSRGPPPSMKEQSGSISNVASKFADKDSDYNDDDEDASSFEEVQKPVDRSERLGKPAPKSLDKVEIPTIVKEPPSISPSKGTPSVSGPSSVNKVRFTPASFAICLTMYSPLSCNQTPRTTLYLPTCPLRPRLAPSISKAISKKLNPCSSSKQ